MVGVIATQATRRSVDDGVAACWPSMDAQPPAAGDATPLPRLIVDAANVVGSVPDGWWLDRAGATERLRDTLASVARDGLAGGPGWLAEPPIEVVLVVEGAAREVAAVEGVRVVAADGSGDDAIVGLVRDECPNRRCVVVTADRELRARVTALGADVLGPRAIRGR